MIQNFNQLCDRLLINIILPTQFKHKDELHLKQHKTFAEPTRVKLEPFLPMKSIVITTTNVMKLLMSHCCKPVQTVLRLPDSVAV